MKVTVKFFATLADYLPAGSHNNQFELEVAESDSVADIIERFRLPEKLVHLVLINGNYVAATARADQRLRGGDQLAIWPPIAGG
ncbi:MAG TPA: MoaD/ThiS family protein [Rhodocyclaceae bacterium]